MMSRQRTLFVISLALLLPLVLAAPRTSTHAGKSDSPAPPVRRDDKKITDETSKGADAYKKLLPELAAAHQKKLDGELGRLKQYAEELSPRVYEAQKKAGFDAEAALKDLQAATSFTNPANAERRASEIQGKYEPQFSRLAQLAGLDSQAERARLLSLVDLRGAQVITAGTIGIGGAGEERREDRSEPPPPPDVKTQTFNAPFTAQGHSGDGADANAATGRMQLSNLLVFAGSVQQLAFVTQDLPVERGVRRVRVFVTLNPTAYGAFANTLGGYSSAEAIVNLRLLEGSRLLASDRLSLGRAVAAVIGDSRVEASRPVTLQCEFTRPAPDDETTYTLVAEIEGWTGAGGLGGAAVNISAILRQFQVYLHRR